VFGASSLNAHASAKTLRHEACALGRRLVSTSTAHLPVRKNNQQVLSTPASNGKWARRCRGGVGAGVYGFGMAQAQYGVERWVSA